MLFRVSDEPDGETRIPPRRQTRALMRIRPALGLILGVLSAVPAFAQDAPREEPPAVAGPDKPSEPGDAQKSVCLLLEFGGAPTACRWNSLPA